MTTTITATELATRLGASAAKLTPTNKETWTNIELNLKNTVKFQLAIAYLFHTDEKISDIELDLVNQEIKYKQNLIGKSLILDNNILTGTFPLVERYKLEQEKLNKVTYNADGNYDGFFSSMFDGKGTSKKSKKVGKKGNKRSR